MVRIALCSLVLALGPAFDAAQASSSPSTSNGDAARNGAVVTRIAAARTIELSGDSIPVGTRLKFALLDPVDLSNARIGDTVRLELRTTVIVNGVEVLPSGLSAQAEVAHADNRGRHGKFAALALKLRRMNWQNGDVRLRNSVLTEPQTSHGAPTLFVVHTHALDGFVNESGEALIPAGAIVLGDIAETISVRPSQSASAEPGLHREYRR